MARVAEGAGPAAGAAFTALGDGPVDSRLRAAILALARHRGPRSSICPSDAARAIGGDSWRELTEQSRSIAFALARDGDVEGRRPSPFDLVGRFKYDAWASHKGMAREEAMRQYISTVENFAKEKGVEI